jgi:hypothetical protein
LKKLVGVEEEKKKKKRRLRLTRRPVDGHAHLLVVEGKGD